MAKALIETFKYAAAVVAAIRMVSYADRYGEST